MSSAGLERCIQLSQELFALASRQSCQPSPSPGPSNSAQAALVVKVMEAGIPRVARTKLPAAVDAALYDATQTHFVKACQDLLHCPRAAGSVPMQTVALQLRDTYASLYYNKIRDMTLKLSSRQAIEKQPFSTDVLLYAFEQSNTPTRRERNVLASLTGLTTDQVRVWFQNRRQRMKKRAPEIQPRSVLQLPELLARVAASVKPGDKEDEFDDNDSGYCSESERGRSATPFHRVDTPLTVHAATLRSYPAPYTYQEPSTIFTCDPPVFRRTAAVVPPVHAQATNITELTHSMSRLTLRHRRETPRSSTGSTTSAISAKSANKSGAKGRKANAVAGTVVQPTSNAPSRKSAARKDPETGRKVAGRRTASATTTASSPLSVPSPTAYPPTASSSPPPTTDSSAKPRKRLGPLRRKPAGKALARQASESSVGSTSSSDSSRSTSYSSDFSLASDSSFTSVESTPTAATMECFQPQQPLQFDPLAAFDFTQLFSSQPSDPLPQPVADFELPPDLLAGLQMPMDTAALPPPESTDFLALLNDPTIQDLLQSVQDMDVVAPQQTQESLTFNNTLDVGSVGSVDTSGFLDLSASTLPTFDAMFGLDASSFQDTLWNSPGFSLPITA